MSEKIAEKKKVLHIVEAMGGGVFTYMVELCNQLVEEYDVYIAYSLRTQTPADYKAYFDKRIKLIRVEHFSREISLIRDTKALFEIKQIVRDVAPDVVHMHSSKAGILGRTALFATKIPRFYTPHGYSFLMENCKHLKRIVYKTLENFFGKFRCTTIACSESEYKESCKVTKKATYISNGINLDALNDLIKDFKPEPNHRPIVYTIGRICDQKNPKLFNEIAKAFPNVDFLWVGDGDLHNELTSKNIKVTGWVHREDAVKMAMQADIFILTSLWEGLPISLLESMYMKKVCIVSNVVGNKDVIINDKNGYICNNLDDYIKHITENLQEQSQELTQNAYDSVVSTYNIQAMSVLYSKEYKKGLGI